MAVYFLSMWPFLMATLLMLDHGSLKKCHAERGGTIWFLCSNSQQNRWLNQLEMNMWQKLSDREVFEGYQPFVAKKHKWATIWLEVKHKKELAGSFGKRSTIFHDVLHS